jgi:tRNA-splicing ligase RtcB
MARITAADLIRLHESLVEIPASYNPAMRVPARVFVNDALLKDVLEDTSLEQIVNVTTLPGIQRAAYAMPDIHQGYGFPIGGVAATDIHDNGIISPGGIGYDINCGVRVLTVDISADELGKKIGELATALNDTIPSGLGRGGSYKLTMDELTQVLTHGAHYWVERGIGNEEDVHHCEEQGKLHTADPSVISKQAKKRGHDQLGTLGSGNHFVEVQKITKLYNKEAAKAFGLREGMVTIMIHCGSRGLGHQTCTDYVQLMVQNLNNWNIVLPDRELACAPFFSPEGQNYFGAMNAAANFAWANRHMIGHLARKACKDVLGRSVAVRTLYDVSHNIGKRERYTVDGISKELLVHRKGATRAFPAHHPELPPVYSATGHPVFVPGTMGTASYILVGTEAGMEQAFGSCCHGAGRKMSRSKARSLIRGSALRGQLEKQGIVVRCRSNQDLVEEAPLAYKEVDEVVQVVEQAGIARLVARVEPIAVIKGN